MGCDENKKDMEDENVVMFLSFDSALFLSIYLDKKVHLSNHHGDESYDRILKPIANELAIHRKNYPMRIIYLKLKYCGYAYGLFERILKAKQCWQNITTHCKTVCMPPKRVA